MAAIDIMDIADQRKAQLEKDDADVRAEETYFSGENGVWGLLTVYDDAAGELLGYEFVETTDSWKRPDAILEYNEAAMESDEVVVIVPDDSFLEAAELITRAGDLAIIISDYSAMELVPRVLVS